MNEAFRASVSLVDTSGWAIIGLIVLLLSSSVFLTVLLRARYARLSIELVRRGGPELTFESPVLERIARDARAAFGQPGEVNTQALIDHAFQTELKSLIVGERFVKASTGLTIILGLVGTFYGLTSSIGKLVGLISADATAASEIAESLTRGLTQALTGMSVAFSTSLIGILSAIALTLLGVFFSIADRRTAVMAEIEAYVDNQLRRRFAAPAAPLGEVVGIGGGAVAGAGQLGAMLASFERSVGQLQGTVEQFHSALHAFATTTRDFREFNHHLKDNVQRMSLSFADLSETLKSQARTLENRD